MTNMKKLMYIQPSVEVTELMMVQTLCVSDTPSGVSFSPIDPNKTTDEQL